jgi:hypothetical protein
MSETIRAIHISFKNKFQKQSKEKLVTHQKVRKPSCEHMVGWTMPLTYKPQYQ